MNTTKPTTNLPMSPGSTALPTVHEIVGAHPGPVLTILGGVHGDELEGVLAARRVAGRLAPDQLRGSLRVVAPAHPAAWEAASRLSPVDGLNLARVFPGRSDGSPTEQVAAFLTTHAIIGSDLLIDLHSAGDGFDMPLMVGYHAGSDAVAEVAARAARAFGAPFLWKHPDSSPGRTLSAAEDHGIPSIYVEGRGGGQVRSSDLDCYVDGVTRVMQELGMVDEAPRAAPSDVVSGEGNTDGGIVSPATGYLVTAVKVGDSVIAGDQLAEILDEQGATIAHLLSPQTGIVMLLKRRARIQVGDTAAIVAEQTTQSSHEGIRER